jgi:hypothetical protein
MFALFIASASEAGTVCTTTPDPVVVTLVTFPMKPPGAVGESERIKTVPTRSVTNSSVITENVRVDRSVEMEDKNC